MNLGQRIRQLRYREGISLSELARRTGVGRVTLSKIENGRAARNHSLLKIARAFGMDLRVLGIEVGLIGLGKTGSVIADSILGDDRFDLVFAIKKTPPRPEDYGFSVETKDTLPEIIAKFKPKIVIDFSCPEATLENIKCLKKNMGIVIGTTGFSEEEVHQLKRYGNKLKILYAPNITDGINILMSAAKVIHNLWKEADVEIIEEHFSTKKDSPSGTAKTISNLFDKKPPIHSVRAGGIVGVHKVIFATPNQKITIEHQSFSRNVFAEATKRAVLWLYGKKKGFYEISEMYSQNLSRS